MNGLLRSELLLNLNSLIKELFLIVKSEFGNNITRSIPPITR